MESFDMTGRTYRT